MPHFDNSSAECLVFTHKEGLLSAVGHDLELRVTRFEIDLQYERRGLRARFEAGSLEVVSAIQEGQPRPGLLSDDDRQKIAATIRTEVLDAGSYVDVRFASSSVAPEGDGYRITGELTLHGKTRLINLTTRREGDRQVGEVELDQRDYGIKPYSAMLGALKVKPHVLVRVSVPDSRPRPSA